jgi:hypothetical protein
LEPNPAKVVEEIMDENEHKMERHPTNPQDNRSPKHITAPQNPFSEKSKKIGEKISNVLEV